MIKFSNSKSLESSSNDSESKFIAARKRGAFYLIMSPILYLLSLSISLVPYEPNRPYVFYIAYSIWVILIFEIISGLLLIGFPKVFHEVSYVPFLGIVAIFVTLVGMALLI